MCRTLTHVERWNHRVLTKLIEESDLTWSNLFAARKDELHAFKSAHGCHRLGAPTCHQRCCTCSTSLQSLWACRLVRTSRCCVKWPALEPANQLQVSSIRRWQERLTAAAEEREAHREVGRRPLLIWWQAAPDSCSKLARMSLSRSLQLGRQGRA